MLKQLNNHWQLSWTCATQPIMQSPDGAVTVQHWLHQVAAAIAYCREQTGDSVLLYQPDCLSFSVWLAALLHLGKQVVLAPDGQPETLAAALSHSNWQVTAQTSLPMLGPNDFLPSMILQWPENASISFFTSGSTGQPKLVKKRLAQLLLEVQTLEQQFASQLPDNAVFAATVSHQHIYGLLFRLLWPLAQQRLIYQPQITYLEQWQALLTKQPVVFIASPAHLTRFDDIAKLTPHNENISAIFSSGGPLAEQVPLRYQQTLNQTPVEIFGSTETGGIAFRQRHTPDTPWQAFNGVSISLGADQRLQVSSDYLDESAFQTQDQVQLLDQRHFYLLGRLDRIVKVEEKRLALPELESFCTRSPLVAEAAALVLNKPKVQLAIVVVLSAPGQDMLITQGKLTVNQQLKQHLLQRFERVLLPKRFRYVCTLPFNQQGKLTYHQLEALFAND